MKILLLITFLLSCSQVARTPPRSDYLDSNLTLDAWYEDMGKRVPLGRVGEAKEAGDLITFLVSERAAFITGVSVNIDGGASPVV